MKTVKEISQLTGLSVSTLHYYDEIQLLKPIAIGENGYRYYDHSSLETIDKILLYRSLGFSLKKIKDLLNLDELGIELALKEQLEMLKKDRENLTQLILRAENLIYKRSEEIIMTQLSKEEIAKLESEARELWGETQAFKDYQEKNDNKQEANEGLILIFKEFSELQGYPPDDAIVQEKVEAYKAYMTQHFYTCDDKVLEGL